MKEIRKLFKKNVVGAFQLYFTVIGRDITNELPESYILVITPHPDDETLGCGATIARMSAEGRRVRIVLVTDGSASSVSKIIMPEQLSRMRYEELKKAAMKMGVKPEDVIFLNHPDGRASAHVPAIARDLAEQIGLFAPSAVFIPCVMDSTSDHCAVASAARLALEQISYKGRIFEYPIWFWPRGALRHMLKITPLASHRRVRADEYVDRKKAALAEHRSQVENLTGEAEWRCLDKAFIDQFMNSYEIFFEKNMNNKSGAALL